MIACVKLFPRLGYLHRQFRLLRPFRLPFLASHGPVLRHALPLALNLGLGSLQIAISPHGIATALGIGLAIAAPMGVVDVNPSVQTLVRIGIGDFRLRIPLLPRGAVHPLPLQKMIYSPDVDPIHRRPVHLRHFQTIRIQMIRLVLLLFVR